MLQLGSECDTSQDNAASQKSASNLSKKIVHAISLFWAGTKKGDIDVVNILWDQLNPFFFVVVISQSQEKFFWLWGKDFSSKKMTFWGI